MVTHQDRGVDQRQRVAWCASLLFPEEPTGARSGAQTGGGAAGAQTGGGEAAGDRGVAVAGDRGVEEDRTFAADLNFDQVVASIVAGHEDPEHLGTLLYRPLDDADAVRYRQEVFTDLEDARLRGALARFCEQMATVRAHLRQLEKMEVRYQREGWQLDAASIYCTAVRALAQDLSSAHLSSRGLHGVRRYVEHYVESQAFTTLEADTVARKHQLAEIRYCIWIRGTKVEVRRYDGEADYSAEVLASFERFRQGAPGEYRATYRAWPGMNRVTARISTLVARLFPKEFADLAAYSTAHAAFFDAAIGRVERELQFYLSYLSCIEPLRTAGLPFCIPEIAPNAEDIFAEATFDLALAIKVVPEGGEVVTNDVSLRAPERIIVVTGPNQGGKTTFARAFGQLCHLVRLGCPVPGTRVRWTLVDRIFTQFEREEDLVRMSGKLEDDIVRARDMLMAATSRSVIVLNEVFSSTTLHDARFLGTKLMRKVLAIGALCVYITFVDELASLGDPVVSMMSTVVPEDPARRTFRVVRRKADGLAYALAIAEKHRVTYERLHQRLSS